MVNWCLRNFRRHILKKGGLIKNGKTVKVFLIFNLVSCASVDKVDQSEIKAKGEQFVKDNLKARNKVEFASHDVNIYNDYFRMQQ